MTISIINVKLAGGSASVADPGSIRDEFGAGDSVPIFLSEYARGGAYVPASQGDAGYGVPAASQPYYMGSFRNQTKTVIVPPPTSFTFNDVVSLDIATGYNLRARAASAGWDQSGQLNASITINAGVTVSGTTTQAAFDLGGPAYPAGTTISLTNNGLIAGLGGAGGAGGSVNMTTLTSGVPGYIGYTGMNITAPISIYNYGTIGGGGGGGGGGSSAYWDTGKAGIQGANGGGGGGGRVYGPAGPAGAITVNSTAWYAAAGSSASASSPGAGGAGGGVGPQGPDGGSGGSGGNLGQPGQPGTQGAGEITATAGPGGGGAAGQAIYGGINITWFVYGSRLGAIDNPGTNGAGGGGATFSNIPNLYISSTPGIANFYSSTDGTYQEVGTDTGTITHNYYSPTSPGIGSFHWIRFTRTSGYTVAGSAQGVWLQMSSSYNWRIGPTPLGQIRTAFCTVEISTDAAGSVIVAQSAAGGIELTSDNT